VVLKILESLLIEATSPLQQPIFLTHYLTQNFTQKLAKSWRDRSGCGLASVVGLSGATATLLFGVAQLGIFQTAELKAFDLLTQMTAQPSKGTVLGEDERVVVVAITEADIQNRNAWPLSDQVFAELLAALQRHSPQVIGLDIYRDVPHAPGTAQLAAQLQQKNIVTITKIDDWGEGEVPSPHQVPADRVGFNDFVIDPDGVIRRNFMFAALGDRQLYSFSLRLVEKYLAPQGMAVTAEANAIKIGNQPFESITARAGGYQTVDASGYQSLMRYLPAAANARQLSLTQVLTGDFDPRWIEGKIVLIGTTAPSQKDLFYTPFSSATRDNLMTSGVEIHAQMTQQILSAVLDQRSPLSTWPQSTEFAWALLWGLGGGLIVWRFSHPAMIAAATATGLAGLGALTGLLFSQALWMPFVLPTFTFSLTIAVLIVYKEFYQTFYDPITRLPNRTRFAQTLQNRLRRSQPAAVILLNIDRFKVFNESLGRQGGDRLLQVIAQRLMHTLPPSAQLARIAGDEFVVLLEQACAEAAIVLAETLKQQVAEPVELERQKLFPTASVGIAVSEPPLGSTAEPPKGQTLNAEDLLRDAQTAMSRAKAHGRGQCEVFAPAMRLLIANQLELEADLREALSQDAFVLYYQPIICLKTLTLAGFEALIRWQHPSKGMVSPVEFIPIAEETGLIVPMGQWVLQVACQQAAAWQQQFSQTSLFMSVNLSGRQFSQKNLVEQIDRILIETGLKRSSLKLELTESVVMDDVEASIEVLLQLKALQLRLGIDDFGTGYSSLSYLHRFPIDTLKVDRSFVMEMEAPNGTAELVKTIIALGHNLGMNVVAEGIETIGQSQQLQSLHCEYGQGYLFAKPLPVEAATALIENSPDWQIYSN
jgi:diguanylate cyclase (GGDEF)-like protein